MAILALVGVTCSSVRVAGVTARVNEPCTPCQAAVTIVAPGLSALACPVELTDTTDALDEFHVTTPVRSCLEPFEYRPTALKNCWKPFGSVPLRAMTSMDSRVALVTVRVVVPVTPARVAVIRVDPAPAAEATPRGNPPPPNEAALGSDEAQVAAAVMSFLEPSLYRAVAEN